MRPPLTPLSLLLCILLAAPAAAQIDAEGKTVPKAESRTVSAPAPAKDPKAPKDDLKYLGDVALLDVVTSNDGAALFRDRGAGTRADPRHYYLVWKTERGDRPAHPLLVFVTPPDGKHAAWPKSSVFLASAPLKVFPGDPEYRGRPFQVWAYPEKPGAKGLFAMVSGFDAHGNPSQSSPILWWGLSAGQELERLPPDERQKAYRELR